MLIFVTLTLPLVSAYPNCVVVKFWVKVRCNSVTHLKVSVKCLTIFNFLCLSGKSCLTSEFHPSGCTRKTRIIDVVYNASNNELVRTKTLVKNCIILVDSTPFRQWYEAHYATPLGRKKGAKLVCPDPLRY